MANSTHEPPGKPMKGKHLRTLAVITPGRWSGGSRRPAPELDLATSAATGRGGMHADEAPPDAPPRTGEHAEAVESETASFTNQIQLLTATQYAVLARFGQFVLGHPAYDALTRRLMQAVREGLQPQRCRLLLRPEHGAEPTHAAGFGDDEDAGGQAPQPCVEVQIAGTDGIYGTLSVWMDVVEEAGTSTAVFVQNLATTVSAYMDRKSAEDRLAYMAQFDALTGLPNRTLYLDRLAHAIDAAGREHTPVAVLFVDIDRFKAVNDTLGHGVGDELLVQIAQRLKSTVRSGDTIGRLSGDEFALVLSPLAQPDHAAIVGQKINDALATPFTIQGHTVYVSGSVGISLFPADGSEPETLLKNADLAMYRAKQSGRNAYQFYLPELQQRALARLQLENQLREALERNEYELEYQPKVDLRTGRIAGLEALLRWRHPQGHLVAPREFIAVLEDTGLIIPVGERVVSMVCAQILQWQGAGLEPPPVSVNISARQFRQDHLDVALTRPIEASGLDPHLFEFELNESMLMHDAEGAIATLKRIKAQGIRLVLDDFGTGYSSLHYLKRFPLDSLKIDREFIRDMLEDANNARIVAAIIGLARTLDLRVVAEGVENAQQLAFLRRHGCDEAQGFGLVRPLPPGEITRLLGEGRRWSFLGTPPPRRRTT